MSSSRSARLDSIDPTCGARSQSVLIVTSARAVGSQPSAPRRFSPTTPPIRSAAAITPSSEPCSSSHLTAVLGPTFGTPGTLSTASPTSVSQSTIRSGGTPNFAITPSRSIGSGASPLRVIVSTSVTWPLTSCARSLSPVATIVRMPRRHACSVSVPITSSASTPSRCSSGQPIARTISWIGAICARRSAGVSARFALYSPYRSSRKVRPGASNTTAPYRTSPASLRLARRFRSIETTPLIAPVGSPARVRRSGSAWNARYR